MGRLEKALDLSRPCRAAMANSLREMRKDAGLTYSQMAEKTGVSGATLKRAASGASVPRFSTLISYMRGCFGGEYSAETIRRVLAEWAEARREERGTLHLRRPNPLLVEDHHELSQALQALYEYAGAPPLREIQRRAGGPLFLPLSTLARIVNGQAIPGDMKQLTAFVKACWTEADDWEHAWERLIFSGPQWPLLRSDWAWRPQWSDQTGATAYRAAVSLARNIPIPHSLVV
ncbi:helix-turn-helix transcriptional regulator [Streptomyces sp. NPDC058623]|uniref:helix-turn-helix transcriptional regulator n=1 Tax=Streptomyces sp. NPDC058623 TaxID=3346563 RepID=UPI003652B680